MNKPVDVAPLSIELIETPLDMARSLADLAFRLDEGKFAFPEEVHAQALACAETMYGMAEVLAGDRAASEEPRTVMPILIEPENLSKKELLEKCKEQHQTMIRQDATIQAVCAKLSAMCSTVHNLGAQLHALVDAFDANDRPAIALQLRQMSDRRKTYKKPEVH